jgi:hypothetical protein
LKIEDMTQHETRELWRERLRDLEEGRATARQLAQRYGVVDSTIHAWRRRLAEEVRPMTSVGLVHIKSSTTDGGLEIHAPRGLSIRVHRGFDPDVLREVLRLLAEG